MHNKTVIPKILLVLAIITVIGCTPNSTNSAGGQSKDRSEPAVDATPEDSHPRLSESRERQRRNSDTSFVDSFLQLKFAKRISDDVPLVINQRLSIDEIIIGDKEDDFAANLVQQAQRKDQRLAEAVSELFSKNQGANTVETFGTLAVEHVILTDKQMGELFNNKGKDGWTEFYKVYPNSPGIITLSRPGFSRDGTLAVIYMGNQTHGRAGRGRIYVLEMKDGKWVAAKMWIGPFWES